MEKKKPRDPKVPEPNSEINQFRRRLEEAFKVGEMSPEVVADALAGLAHNKTEEISRREVGSPGEVVPA